MGSTSWAEGVAADGGRDRAIGGLFGLALGLLGVSLPWLGRARL
jgi:hypothetical protein